METCVNCGCKIKKKNRFGFGPGGPWCVYCGEAEAVRTSQQDINGTRQTALGAMTTTSRMPRYMIPAGPEWTQVGYALPECWACGMDLTEYNGDEGRWLDARGNLECFNATANGHMIKAGYTHHVPTYPGRTGTHHLDGTRCDGMQCTHASHTEHLSSTPPPPPTQPKQPYVAQPPTGDKLTELLNQMGKSLTDANIVAVQDKYKPELCDCCGQERAALPYHHDNHNPPYDGYDYCQICYDAGCGGPSDCAVPEGGDVQTKTKKTLRVHLAEVNDDLAKIGLTAAQLRHLNEPDNLLLFQARTGYHNVEDYFKDFHDGDLDLYVRVCDDLGLEWVDVHMDGPNYEIYMKEEEPVAAPDEYEMAELMKSLGQSVEAIAKPAEPEPEPEVQPAPQTVEIGTAGEQTTVSPEPVDSSLSDLNKHEHDPNPEDCTICWPPASQVADNAVDQGAAVDQGLADALTGLQSALTGFAGAEVEAGGDQVGGNATDYSSLSDEDLNNLGVAAVERDDLDAAQEIGIEVLKRQCPDNWQEIVAQIEAEAEQYNTPSAPQQPVTQVQTRHMHEEMADLLSTVVDPRDSDTALVMLDWLNRTGRLNRVGTLDGGQGYLYIYAEPKGATKAGYRPGGTQGDRIVDAAVEAQRATGKGPAKRGLCPHCFSAVTVDDAGNILLDVLAEADGRTLVCEQSPDGKHGLA